MAEQIEGLREAIVEICGHNCYRNPLCTEYDLDCGRCRVDRILALPRLAAVLCALADIEALASKDAAEWLKATDKQAQEKLEKLEAEIKAGRLVWLADDQSFPKVDPHQYDNAMEVELGQQTMWTDGFRRVEPAGDAQARPAIVCLCGSTRFTDIMLVKQWELRKQGCIVLSWCALPDSYFQGEDKAHIGDQEGVRKIVDELHLRKIDLADEVLILNVGGYIGESTQRELDYARSKGKKVSFLEPESRRVEQAEKGAKE